MRVLAVTIIVIILCGLYLWRFDPVKSKHGLENKLHVRNQESKPAYYWCSLKKSGRLVGKHRCQHSQLSAEEVALKHIIASTLNSTTALKETLHPKEAPLHQKLSREECKKIRYLISMNCTFYAISELQSINGTRVHVIGKIGKRRINEKWYMLGNSERGWVVVDIADNE